MKTINCQRCGKEVEARGARKYCTKCRKIMDDILAKEYIEKHRKEINEKQKARNRENSLKKKMMQYDW